MNTIHLRAIEPEDLDFLYRIENDVKLWNVGITNVPYSRYALHDYVANASGDIYTDHQVRLTAVMPSTTMWPMPRAISIPTIRCG